MYQTRLKGTERWLDISREHLVTLLENEGVRVDAVISFLDSQGHVSFQFREYRLDPSPDFCTRCGAETVSSVDGICWTCGYEGGKEIPGSEQATKTYFIATVRVLIETSEKGYAADAISVALSENRDIFDWSYEPGPGGYKYPFPVKIDSSEYEEGSILGIESPVSPPPYNPYQD